MAHNRGIGVLCFHRVLPSNRRSTTDEPYFLRQTAMELDHFRRLLDRLEARCEVLPPERLLEWYTGGIEAERPPIVLTFDDGYLDVLEHAVPELTARGHRAIVAITTAVAAGSQSGFPVDNWYAALMTATRQRGRLESLGAPAWEYDLQQPEDFQRLIDGPEKRAFLQADADEQARLVRHLRIQLGCGEQATLPPVLRPSELRVLSEAGWLLASHGNSHALMPGLGQARALEELASSRCWFSQVRLPEPHIIAWPDGAVDDSSAQAAAEAGYRLGLVLGGRLAGRADPWWALPRLIPRNSPTWFKERLEPLLRQDAGRYP